MSKPQKIIVNSDAMESHAIATIRSLFRQYKYVRVTLATGKDRSKEMNALTHVWYGQVSDERGEETPLEVKRFCKLHFGIPILRAEDEEFRNWYDTLIGREGNSRFTYEEKLQIMDKIDVTSEMSQNQIMQYAKAMQNHYEKLDVLLKFPEKDD